MEKDKIGIILSTTRKRRVADSVLKWVIKEAEKEYDADYEVIDFREYNMGFFGDPEGEEMAAKFNNKMKELDAYIFIVAEYNHSIPGVLKSALDWVSQDSVANKPAGIISYGAVGGARAAEHLRTILGQLSVADISRQVLFSTFNDFENFRDLNPIEVQYKAFKEFMEQLTNWLKALKSIR